MKDKNGHLIEPGNLMYSDKFSRGTLVVMVTEVVFSSDATLGEGEAIKFSQRRTGEAETTLTQEQLLESHWVFHSNPKPGKE
jgi:hypothetical protein